MFGKCPNNLCEKLQRKTTAVNIGKFRKKYSSIKHRFIDANDSLLYRVTTVEDPQLETPLIVTSLLHFEIQCEVELKLCYELSSIYCHLYLLVCYV